MTSNLSAFDFIQERSEATPGLFNRFLSALSANIAAVDSNATINLSGATLSIGSSVSIGRDLWVKGSVTVGVEPSVATRTAVNIGVRSDTSDYLYFTDESALRSNYIVGSHVGGTADGLNIWDASGSTMLVSFSKQSIRFFQNVVGPVFDVGGALASTLNAATFGTGADSDESRIQAAINQASIDAIARVYVPANMYPYSASSISFIHSVQMVREGGDWSVFDIAAYGARATGTSSNTSAIQAAVSGATTQGGNVFIPSNFTLPGLTGVFGVFTGSETSGARLLSGHVPTVSVHGNSNYVPGDATPWGQVHVYSQIMATGAPTAGGADLMLMAPKHRLGGVDYDVHITGQRVAGVNSDGVLFIDMDIKVSDYVSAPLRGHGLRITQTDNSPVMEFPISGGLIEVSGKLRGGSSAASNIVLRVGSTSGNVIVEDFAGTTQLLVMANNGLLQLVNRIRSIDGTLGNPMYAFTSDANTGWYRSAVSTVGLSGAALALPVGSTTTPALNFSSESSLGFYRSGASAVGMSFGQFTAHAGTALLPGIGFSSESSLGFYRSGNSTLRTSYGTFYGGGEVWAASALSAGNALTVSTGNVTIQNGNISNTGASGTDVFHRFTQSGVIAWDIKNEATSGRFVVRDNTNAVNVLSATNSGLSLGSGLTFNFNKGRVVSVRTAASLDSTTLATDECAFSFNASGSSLAIRSGGTIWYFTSSASTKG